MKRPLLFAAELLAAMALATAGAWLADRWSRKHNREAQAEERIAAALERAFPPRIALPRPSLLHRADLKPIPQPDPEPCSPGWDRATCDWARGKPIYLPPKGVPLVERGEQ